MGLPALVYYHFSNSTWLLLFSFGVPLVPLRGVEALQSNSSHFRQLLWFPVLLRVCQQPEDLPKTPADTILSHLNINFGGEGEGVGWRCSLHCKAALQVVV